MPLAPVMDRYVTVTHTHGQPAGRHAIAVLRASPGLRMAQTGDGKKR